jgi:tetratricopeptide (TPR) repeat protein
MNENIESPKTAEDYKTNGNKYYQEKKYQDAITEYDKALALKPDYKEAWLNKGLAHKNLEQYAQAKDSFKRALTIDAQYDKARYQYKLLIVQDITEEKKSNNHKIPHQMHIYFLALLI